MMAQATEAYMIGTHYPSAGSFGMLADTKTGSSGLFEDVCERRVPLLPRFFLFLRSTDRQICVQFMPKYVTRLRTSTSVPS